MNELSKGKYQGAEVSNLYELDSRKATEIGKIVNLHGYKTSKRLVTSAGNVTKKDGVYLLIGNDDKKINELENLNDIDLYQEALYESKNDFLVFPRGAVFKIDRENSLQNLSNILDHIEIAEFITKKFTEYNKEIPEKISGNDFNQLYYSYRKMINSSIPQNERLYFKENFEYLIDVISSGMKESEFLEANRNNKDFKYKDRINTLDNKKPINTKIYKSNSPNCVSYEELLSAGKKLTSMSVDRRFLGLVEKDLKEYSDIKYHINEKAKSVDLINDDSVLSAYNAIEENSKRYFHMLTFSVEDEQVISSIVHMRENQAIKDKAAYLFYNPNNPKIGISIPANDLENFIKYASFYDIKYQFDVDGVYADSSAEKIGIVVDTRDEFIRLNQCLKQLYEDKANYCMIDYEKEKEVLLLDNTKDKKSR